MATKRYSLRVEEVVRNAECGGLVGPARNVLLETRRLAEEMLADTGVGSCGGRRIVVVE